MDKAIEASVHADYRRLVGTVSMVTGSVAIAEEAVQEAFTKAIEQHTRGVAIDNVTAWVMTVALNLARTGRRRGASEHRALTRLGARPPRTSGTTSEISMVVREAVSGLAHRQRDAVILYYFFDQDVATVARTLGISEGTVKSALSRARARLSELLHDEQEDA